MMPPILRWTRAWFLKNAAPMATITLRNAAQMPTWLTRSGALLCGFLLAMFIWSVNYRLNLGYALTFILATWTIFCAILTAAELAQLQLSCAPRTEGVFAGERAEFILTVRENEGKARGALQFESAEGVSAQLSGLKPLAQGELQLSFATQRRGVFSCPALVVASTNPLGWFISWQWFWPQAQVWVYPEPKGSQTLPPHWDGHGADERAQIGTGDALDGLRTWQPGERLAQVAWKESARSQEWQAKHFAGSDAAFLFDYHAVRGDVETRLSQLAAWIVLAQQRGMRFALRLPEQDFAVDSGAKHCRICLRALALFRL